MKGFLTQGAQDILLYFLCNPERQHHLRELAHVLNKDPGNLSREMRRLSKRGLFNVLAKGRLKLFSLNKKNPLYKEIKGIILKTQGPPVIIGQALQGLKGLETALLYGSYVDQSADLGSDIDLLLIGELSSLDLAKILRPLEKKLGREIHFRIMSQIEFDKRIKAKDPFLMTVVKGKTHTLLDQQ
jgi:predicted nucleotidyltransferase